MWCQIWGASLGLLALGGCARRSPPPRAPEAPESWAVEAPPPRNAPPVAAPVRLAAGCAGEDWEACDRECRNNLQESCVLLAAHLIHGCGGELPLLQACERLKQPPLTNQLVRAQAGELLRERCLNGGGDACLGLARLYLVGSGVPKDFPKAAEYSELACQAGSATGCELAGKAWTFGVGVPLTRLGE